MSLVRCILGEFLRGSLPLLSPAFRRSHLSPPGASTSATTRVILATKGIVSYTVKYSGVLKGNDAWEYVFCSAFCVCSVFIERRLR